MFLAGMQLAGAKKTGRPRQLRWGRATPLLRPIQLGRSDRAWYASLLFFTRRTSTPVRDGIAISSPPNRRSQHSWLADLSLTDDTLAVVVAEDYILRDPVCTRGQESRNFIAPNSIVVIKAEGEIDPIPYLIAMVHVSSSRLKPPEPPARYHLKLIERK